VDRWNPKPQMKKYFFFRRRGGTSKHANGKPDKKQVKQNNLKCFRSDFGSSCHFKKESSIWNGKNGHFYSFLSSDFGMVIVG
jgi:hypothetical protein